MWPDRRILDLFGIELPIIQAPMAGAASSALAIAVSEAGGLGSLPTAVFTPDRLRNELGIIRQQTSRPINVNFFCHAEPVADPAREARWRRRLGAYYEEAGIDAGKIPAGPGRAPFDDAMCDVVVAFAPEVVSFHFGLPERRLLDRVRSAGTKIISSATTVDEARWLEDQGCDAIIAQGFEAGGHRGVFLETGIENQVGTFALVPQVADAVKVPVIAAGGVADGRGVAAAFALGASAVQVGTAYLLCAEAEISPIHRAALRATKDNQTVLTNIFTGRPARGIANRVVREVGPMSADAPQFPLATSAITPLRSHAEKSGSGEFSPLWSGQAAALARAKSANETGARDLTLRLAADALARFGRTRPPAFV